MLSLDTIATIVRSGGRDVSLSTNDFHAIVEIAFLSIAADNTIHPDEEKGLRLIARCLRKLVADDGASGASASSVPEADAVVDELFVRLGTRMPREVADEHLRVVAAKLTAPRLRGLAYQLAYTLALADLATADQEFEFDLQLIDALGIPQAQVDALTEDVLVALGVEKSDT